MRSEKIEASKKSCQLFFADFGRNFPKKGLMTENIFSLGPVWKKLICESFPSALSMSEEAGRRRSTKRLDTESVSSTSSSAKGTGEESVVSPRGSGSSAGRTRLGSLSKDKESSAKPEKEKSKSKDKDKEGRNKHALSRTAARQNSIMPIPMPSPDKVEEIFVKLLVRHFYYSIFNLCIERIWVGRSVAMHS